MWTEEQMIGYLKNNIKEKRLKHCLRVKDTAEKLAKIYNVDKDKAAIAGLMHDLAKEKTSDEVITLCKKEGYNVDPIVGSNLNTLHGAASAIIARDLMGVTDEDTLNAMAYHTIGRKNMSTLEKVIYLADYIEPFRDFDGVEQLRILAQESLDEAMLKAFDNTIKFVISKGELVHIGTIEARNFILLQKINK